MKASGRAGQWLLCAAVVVLAPGWVFGFLISIGSSGPVEGTPAAG